MNRIFKKVWNRRRGCFVAVSEAMSSAGQRAGKAACIVAASALLSGNVFAENYSGDYSGQVKWGSGSTVAAGEVANLLGGSSQRGHWNVYGTLNAHGYVLLSGENPGSDQCDDIEIFAGGAYNIMSNGDIQAKASNSGDTNAHGFLNHGTLYSASGSIMQFTSPYSVIRNFETGYVELNGSLNLSGLIDNASNFVTNGGMTVTSSGNVQNSKNFTNNSTIDFAGNWSGNGTLINNGTFNLNSGTFSHEIKGNGRFIYAGGSFSSNLISENLTLQINQGLSATVGNASNANIDNYGNFSISSGILNSVVNQQGAVFNFTGASLSVLINNGEATVNADLNITGSVVNTGTLVTAGKWNFNGGRLTSNGTVITDNANNVFDTFGESGSQELNYVSLGSTTPQTVRTSLNNFFRKYLPGTVSQTLAQNASFTRGKIVITGVNLTTTQRDDLVKAFKAQFFEIQNED
ncbi:ESPR-type extended signal peptide-containing protein [uncultured Parasutterella sp.]|uniref:ESPR-type extended signal peptide-containing protein n=1 Tax=uncultured Parasutterella sp. TaxID=1263098 RepID=UPI0025B283D1|nr:ESPR-type extended signal peptide-containing protein [uncultured Parasutterella sp.]